MTESQVLLCRMEELPDGNSRGFDPFKLGRDSVIVVRNQNSVFAYQNACPHVDGSPLAWKKDKYLNAGRDRIICNGHGAEFDIQTGLCTLGPCLGQSLTPVRVQATAEGDLFLMTDQSLETTK